MTSDLVGIENDQSQIIIDRVEKALNEKGVVLVSQRADPLTLISDQAMFRGMGNGRWATIDLPSLKDLSEEQIQEKASEIIKEVESKIQAGGDGGID